MKPTQIAELITVVGNSAAIIATVEGQSLLGETIQAETLSAAATIAAWVPGTESTVAIQVLNLLMSALQLIPVIGPYTILIDIAIVTVEEIIALFPAMKPALAAKYPGIK